ncbi:MAG: tRNA 2-thiocytidine(32) synthetase TtcA [Myxococcales bacterium]|nr:tRNA 2-thiocytidine(32) synthetase TtcA [Myxococcales bacterium]
MLHLLERARRRSPVRFEIVAVHLDQGHPGYDGTPLERWCEAQGFDLRVVRENTYGIVTERIPEGKTYCSLCSRLRRGILYNLAAELGCTKIALGHHADDAIETLLLNLCFAGSLGAMPPKLVTKDGRNTVIRPLLYAKEKTIARFAELMAFPILPCNLCGSQENLQRAQMKTLVDDLETRIPRVRESMLAALAHVKPTHLLDAALREGLGATVAIEGAAEGDGASRAESAAPAKPSRQGARQLPVV